MIAFIGVGTLLDRRRSGHGSLPIARRRPPTGKHTSRGAVSDLSAGRWERLFVGLSKAAPQRSDREPRSMTMDYAKPTDVVQTMIDSAGTKLALAPRDLMIRGMMSGAL